MEQETIKIPQKGTTYYYVRGCIGSPRFEVCHATWTSSSFGLLRLAKGNVYYTPKEAQDVADLLNRRINVILSSKQ